MCILCPAASTETICPACQAELERYDRLLADLQRQIAELKAAWGAEGEKDDQK